MVAGISRAGVGDPFLTLATQIPNLLQRGLLGLVWLQMGGLPLHRDARQSVVRAAGARRRSAGQPETRRR
jgi:hypothetical protein